MRRIGLLAAAAAIVASGGWGSWHAQAAPGMGETFAKERAGDPEPTWTEHVAPILAENCMNCHRPGQVAPMSLVTYEDAAPWAPLIRFVVEERIMPPWHAEPEASASFGNDRQLTEEEIGTIVRWAEVGAPRGQGEFQPPEFPAGNWLLAAELGPPDFVWQFDEPIEIPATGPDLWPEVVIPTTHDEDIWIQAAEVRGNSRVVHHSTVRVIPPDGGQDPSGRLAAYTPGKQYDRFPEGSGKMIPAGSTLRFGMHYNTAGRAEEDVHGVAVWLARDTIRYRIHSSVVADPSIDIPPYEAAYRSEGSREFDRDVEITLMKPHMHWRGNDMLYRAVSPEGEITNLLFIPNYDMNWQISYELEEPFPIPAGGRLEVVAHFDNSPRNPWNPDPSQRVLWGMDSRDEMMEGWFDYQVRLDEPVIPPTIDETVADSD